jgi:hypothetical protein
MDLDILVENRIDMQCSVQPALVATILVKEKWPITSIDLVLGYHKAGNAPLLKTFLSRAGDMISHVAKSFRKSWGALPFTTQ